MEARMSALQLTNRNLKQDLQTLTNQTAQEDDSLKHLISTNTQLINSKSADLASKLLVRAGSNSDDYTRVGLYVNGERMGYADAESYATDGQD
nr:hypothetical protein BaRGS_010013 [Batillaria attramentaria]